jgi:16S rRNA pseudouridine516 synthase
LIRLDKFLADAGTGTRSEVKNLIRKGLVKVNDLPALKPELKLDPETDQVEVNGQPVQLRGMVYYLLHKPAGYVSAVKDNLFPTVMELVPKGDDLFPVGRLDKDTEGLLLITNDGNLAHRLLSPRRHVDKSYLAVLDKPATQEDISLFAAGVNIGDDEPTLPAALELLPDNNARLTIHEGRFHQVKRMFHAVGKEVLYLKRLSMGPIRLSDDLPKGSWRELSSQEIDALSEAAGLSR